MQYETGALWDLCNRSIPAVLCLHHRNIRFVKKWFLWQYETMRHFIILELKHEERKRLWRQNKNRTTISRYASHRLLWCNIEMSKRRQAWLRTFTHFRHNTTWTQFYTNPKQGALPYLCSSAFYTNIDNMSTYQGISIQTHICILGLYISAFHLVDTFIFIQFIYINIWIPLIILL